MSLEPCCDYIIRPSRINFADVVKLLNLLILSQKEDDPRYDEPRQMKLLKQTPKIPLLTVKKPPWAPQLRGSEICQQPHESGRASQASAETTAP